MTRPPRFFFLAALALVFTACSTSGGGSPPPTGNVLPTVAGRPPTTFANGEEARRAFTRVGGSLTARLEDSAWLRFEGDPECVAAEHRAYFDYGYTTFQVELRSKEFTQPTAETFILEDSAGRRVQGRPRSYDALPGLQEYRYFFTSFSISFQHVITADLQWIRLTRPADGSMVEWRFQAPAPCAPPPPGPPCVR